MQKSTQVGASSVEEDGDIVVVHWVGLPTPIEVQRIYDVLEQHLRASGHHRVLFDLSRVDPKPPGAEQRRHAAEWWRRHGAQLALASYGMSWPVRVIMDLVRRAVGLFGPEMRSRYFATEAEARAWLHTQA